MSVGGLFVATVSVGAMTEVTGNTVRCVRSRRRRWGAGGEGGCLLPPRHLLLPELYAPLTLDLPLILDNLRPE